MHDRSRNNLCSGSKTKSRCWNIKKFHLLKTFFSMYFRLYVLIRNIFLLVVLNRSSDPNSNKYMFFSKLNYSVKITWKNLNRWIKTPWVSRNIFCVWTIQKFWIFDSEKVHLVIFFKFIVFCADCSY